MPAARLNLTTAVTSLLFLSMVVATVQADIRNVNFRDIRALGMGGPGVATMKGFDALIYNPAMLAKSEFGLELINVEAHISKDAFDLVDFIDKNQDILDNYTDADYSDAERQRLVDDMARFDNNSLGAGVYPKLGLSLKNFAIGAYATSDIDFRLDMGIIEPRIFIDGHADVVYSAGFAAKLQPGLISFLMNDLFVGGAIKIIKRQTVSYKATASDADFDSVVDSLREDLETGWGVDLGALYEIVPGKIDLGVKVVDLLASIEGDKPPTIFNVGASWRYSKALLFAADYNDFFMHRGANFFNRLHFGAEFNLGKIMMLRGGFGQGYPSAGAGLDFGGLQFDVAVYGIEKGSVPGGDGDYMYSARLKIGI